MTEQHLLLVLLGVFMLVIGIGGTGSTKFARTAKHHDTILTELEKLENQIRQDATLTPEQARYKGSGVREAMATVKKVPCDD
jgi:hypothetical protein